MSHLLHTLLLESAKRNPDKIAVKLRDKNICYDEFNSISDRLASCLIRNGVRLGDRIGMYLDKSIDGVISILGILKAGACYVPLDPIAPVNRQSYIISDCNMRYLIVSSNKFFQVWEIISKKSSISCIINLDKNKFKKNNLPKQTRLICRDEILKSDVLMQTVKIKDTDPAYILYTSGSTGKPKGVTITHKASMAFVDWAYKCFNISENDMVAGYASFNFDLSIFDIFVTIKAGATLCLIPQGVSIFPKSLAKFIEKEKITVWYSVPYPLIQLVLYSRLEKRNLLCLKQVLYAGDVFPVKYLRKLMTLIPHAKFYNLYGPTETNVCAYYPIKEIPSKTETVPIGKACSGARLFAFNKENKPIKPGQVGELYVSGPSLMEGYWNDLAKTREAFRYNCMVNKNDKLYRTGDLVTINSEGDYIFIGRKDSMIKSRGYRIELGEIESVLYEHPNVQEVTVFAVPNKEIGKKIKAVVVPKKSCSVSEQEIRHFCSIRLLRYAIPEIFEFRNSLPRTSRGKVDRAVL